MMAVQIIIGDCIDAMRPLRSGSAQCCVTSPPYFGLRDYGIVGQIGMEDTPDAYTKRLTEVFREVWRVLADDGTLWLNLGDSYSPNKQRRLLPARVAIALQGDGWIIRDEIVWHKPRTTPAPVMDRTVAAHEMVYLLSKRARYFFDWAAIEEPSIHAGAVRLAGGAKAASMLASGTIGGRKRPSDGRQITVRDTRRSRSVWSISPSPFKGAHLATMPPSLVEKCILAGSRPGDVILDPFAGAGTTGLVADRLGRHAALCEINPEYADLAASRIGRDKCHMQSAGAR